MKRESKGSQFPPECVATSQEVEDFANKTHEGPTPDYFKLQLGAERATPWNEQAIEVLMAYINDKNLPSLPDKKEMRRLVKTHIDGLAAQYKKRNKPKEVASSLSEEDERSIATRDQRRRNVSSISLLLCIANVVHIHKSSMFVERKPLMTNFNHKMSRTFGSWCLTLSTAEMNLTVIVMGFAGG
jgi:hypothetical protein